MCIYRLFVNVTLFISYIGISSVYVVFISGIIQEIVDPEKHIGQGTYALMLFPFLFVVNLMRNLNDITPLSIIGNVFVILACGIGFIYALKDGFGDTWLTTQPDLKVYPRFIGAIFFSLCSPGLVTILFNCFITNKIKIKYVKKKNFFLLNNASHKKAVIILM